MISNFLCYGFDSGISSVPALGRFDFHFIHTTKPTMKTKNQTGSAATATESLRCMLSAQRLKDAVWLHALGENHGGADSES